MDFTTYNSGMASALMNGAAPLTGALTDPFSTSPNFLNPSYVTPQQAVSMRAYGDALMKNQQSVHRPLQGVSNIINAVLGGNADYQADHAQQGAIANATQQDAPAYSAALGQTAAGASPQPTANGGAGPAPSQTTPPTPASDASPGFNRAVNRTLGFEGGLNPSDTNGTPSNMGINQAANPGVDVSSLTPDQAKGIYKSNYWDSIGADNMPAPLARVAFDTAVIAGPAKAQELVAQSGGDPNKLLDLRQQFQNGLIQSDPQKYGQYAQAWQNRNDGLRSDVAAMSQPQAQGGAAQAIGAAAPQVGQPPSIPSSAMAFSGPTQAPNPMATALMGGPGAAPPPAGHQAMAQALMQQQPPGQGAPPYPAGASASLVAQPTSGFTGAQASAIMNNPWTTDQTKALVGSLVNPQIVEDSIGNKYYQRPGQALVPIAAGARFGNTTVGGQNLPIVTTGSPAGQLHTNVLQPGANANGSPPGAGGQQPNAASANPADPIAGYRPMIAAGQDIQAQGDAKTHAAGLAGDQLARDRQAAGSFNQTIYPLTQAIPALEALGTTGSGPGTEQLNQLKSTLQSLGLPGFDASKITNYDTARQLLGAYVGQNGGTNQLIGAFSGNPTANMSNSAAVDYVKSALSLQRMQQAKVIAFGQSGLPESDYPKFALNFASTQDPRAYGFDLMNKQARAQLGASMPAGSSARTKFNASYKSAMSTGMVPGS